MRVTCLTSLLVRTVFVVTLSVVRLPHFLQALSSLPAIWVVEALGSSAAAAAAFSSLSSVG